MHPAKPYATWQAAIRLLMLCLSMLAADSALAISLGNASLQSRIGEPLRVSIPLGRLGSLDRESIIVGHAPEADYDRLGIERGSDSLLHFELVVDRRGNASIEVRSQRPLTEPYVDMVVQVRWPSGRLVRAYTLLLDLPTSH